MDRNCENCNRPFTAFTAHKRFCSKGCASVLRPIKAKRKTMLVTKSCENCGEPITGRTTIRFCQYGTECYTERRKVYMRNHRDENYIPLNPNDLPRPEALKRVIRFGNKVTRIQSASPEKMIKLIENYY